jgi:hypothetical protein
MELLDALELALGEDAGGVRAPHALLQLLDLGGPGAGQEVVQLGLGVGEVGAGLRDFLGARAGQEVAQLGLCRASGGLAALDVGAELCVVDPHEDLPDLHQLAHLGFDGPHALDGGHDIATRDLGHADGGWPEDEDGEAARDGGQDRDGPEPRVGWPERAPIHAEIAITVASSTSQTSTGASTFLSWRVPRRRRGNSPPTRPAVSGPMRIWPRWASAQSRAARLVTVPVAVYVHRSPAMLLSLVDPTSAVPELMPMLTAIGGCSRSG